MNLKAEKFKAYIAENNITNFKVEDRYQTKRFTGNN